MDRTQNLYASINVPMKYMESKNWKPLESALLTLLNDLKEYGVDTVPDTVNIKTQSFDNGRESFRIDFIYNKEKE